MDTLSSSVSTLKIPTLLSSTSSRELHQFNPQSPRTHKLPPQSHLHSTTKPNLISNKTPSFSHKLVPLSSTPSFLNSSATLSLNSSSSSDLHRKPATGYAAALLDIAQCNNSVHLVEKDIQRFLKLLHNKLVQAALANPFVGEKEKGQVVNLVAEKGRFNRHLVGLVKMLVRKNKVGIVKEVLEEFQRIYNELSGTAKKVKNLVHESLLSFAV
ncbi:ATP synthase delta chain chloroplastic [Prunus yedoensis var. nudiflora]|uniref:ATP synthase delta chain chloroplastic n=1 Tax=Prunus yedoensis var. nudiflora TaxID=2094558 RepID=A0A314ZU37_PRUYE|nr:ATP synthase delta chain chloroplastic [Prunus yedoensis var. nudiflora]